MEIRSSEPNFDEMRKVTARHTRSYGKVSTWTGASSVLKGEFFGAGFTTTFTEQKLFQAIKLKYGETLANSVARQLSIQSQSDKPINSYKVAKAVALVADWKKVHTTEINYQEVEQGVASGKPIVCRTTLTSLGHLKSLANNLDVFGVSSTDGNNKNVVNGWVEEMHIGSNATSSTRFLRSGMLMPAGVDATKSDRENTAKTRYKQILSAMIETTPSLIPDNFEATATSEEKPLEIEHAHIGLISTNDSKKPEELQMAKDQMAFIRDNVNGKLVQVDYCKPGTTDVIKIWVRPKVLYTNFSVQKPQKSGASVPETDSPDAETEKTLDHYLGRNEQKSSLLKKIATLPEGKQQEARVLLNRLLELRSTRSQEGSSFYSYEFQTKYSLLLAKCGIPTHVYCKSGKDRTSRFSEMIKMWASNPKLELNKMTRAVRNLIKAFSFSGNATVQRLNTGFAGNKQAKTYWRLIAGEKQNRNFGGWTHLFSAAWYAPWWSVKT